MNSSQSGDVVIIGAGLIGLSLAFELAGRGATVRIFDRGEPGKAASWAGAGMLAPYTEEIDDEPLRQLCERSLAMYPAFTEIVRQESGVDPQLRLDGILSVAYGDGLSSLRERAARLHEHGIAADTLDRMQTLALEPALAPTASSSLLVHGEGQVDNRRLGRALLAACEKRGVVVETNVSAVAVRCNPRRVLGVSTNGGFSAADAVVNATGAWAAQLDEVPRSCVPDVHPVKGQMLSLEIPRGLMQRVTWVPGAYLVPRADGRLLVGATVEYVDFDQRVTADGMHKLLQAALPAASGLQNFTIGEMWGGLRPGTPDGRPYLGPTPLEGYFVATGHYRNGILLAPVTAVLLADAIEGNAAACAPFLLDRGVEMYASRREVS
jgi:glycine oxidase